MSCFLFPLVFFSSASLSSSFRWVCGPGCEFVCVCVCVCVCVFADALFNLNSFLSRPWESLCIINFLFCISNAPWSIHAQSVCFSIESDVNSLIVVCCAGGITHDTFQKELMCFDPDADKWTQKAPMTTVRGLHCMCTVGDRLYVIGGNHFRGTSDYDDVLSCEYYSPALDLWTPIAAMLRGQSDVGVAVFENKIYVVGGYSWNNRCMVEIVQKYDPEKDEWHKVFDLPESLGGIRACTLTVFPPEDLSLSGSPNHESPLSAPWEWMEGEWERQE